MKKNRFALPLVSALMAVRAYAVDPRTVLMFSRDPVSLRPQFALSQTFSDNLFSERENRNADWVTTLSPGLDLRLGRDSGNLLALKYTFNQHIYVDHPDLNAPEHLFDLKVRLRGERLTLEGNDRVQFLATPIGGVQTLVTESVTDRPIVVTEANVERLSIFNNYQLNYTVSEKTLTYIQGSHSLIDYSSSANLFDFQSMFATLGGGYRATGKTLIFGEGFHGLSSATPNRNEAPTTDVSSTGGAIGARGAFTAKLSGNLRFGYEFRHFRGTELSPSAPVVSLGLTEAFSEKTSLTIGYTRRQDVSIQFGGQSFTADSMTASLTQILGPSHKWRATLSGSYGRFRFDSRADASGVAYDAYTVNFSLAYQIQLWLTASLGYDRTSILSRLGDLIEYDINRFSFRFAIGY